MKITICLNLTLFVLIPFCDDINSLSSLAPYVVDFGTLLVPNGSPSPTTIQALSKIIDSSSHYPNWLVSPFNY